VPEAGERLSEQIARFLQALRGRRLLKAPGVAETIDWARALVRLHADRLEPELIEQTLGVLLKDRHDLSDVRGVEVASLLEQAAAAS
jgi:hypothetical protein